MKKFFAGILFVLMIFCPQAQAREISSADSTFAIETINNELRKWNCTPLKIWFSKIPLDDAENVAYMNQLADGYGFDKRFTACMVFYSDFKSPPDPHDGKPTAWNYDSEYKNYQPRRKTLSFSYGDIRRKKHLPPVKFFCKLCAEVEQG
ncbi:MAG: hypothetical protein IJ685_08170 [Selenomonadaceae bacterium]|nr:hypothetical protein [Selenomonadaceae bacterium]